MWLVFGLMALFVLLTRERTLLDPNSFLRQRYAPIPRLMFLHGIPGVLALCLGVLQFSTHLRQRHLQLHRVLGRIYVGCAIISAPVAIAVAHALPVPTVFMATLIQSTAWLVATATAMYCARSGRIQQHREWMMRGYPFAAVFIVNRVIFMIPAIERMGPLGHATVVWTDLSLACLLPSFVIAWQAMPAARRTPRPRAAQAAN